MAFSLRGRGWIIPLAYLSTCGLKPQVERYLRILLSQKATGDREFIPLPVYGEGVGVG